MKASNGRSGRGRSLEFLRGFLRNPREVASIVPSSAFLTRRVGECGDAASARAIVELGPGTGVITEQLLRHMPPDGVLVAVEINPRFARLLRERFRDDPRLIVYEGSATDLEKALAEARLDSVDLVVSGIPFSMIEQRVGRATLEAARRALAPDGRFVAYQFRSDVARAAEPVFGRPRTHSGFWNIPPMRIYVWGENPPS